MRFSVKEIIVIIVSLPFFGVSRGLSWIAENLKEFDGMIHTLAYVVSETFVDGRVLSGIGYIAIGIICTKIQHKPNQWLYVIILLFGLIMEALGISVTNTVSRAIFAYVLFEITKNFQSETPKYFSCVLRRASKVLYFVHMIWYFIGGFEDLSKMGAIPFGVTLALSLATAYLVEKCRERKYVIIFQ